MGGVAQIGNNLNAEQRVPSGYAEVSENAPFLSEDTKKAPPKRMELFNVGITYLPGQSPAKYCRRV